MMAGSSLPRCLLQQMPVSSAVLRYDHARKPLCVTGVPDGNTELATQTAYNRKEEVHQYLRQVIALPYLPAEHIRAAFDYLDDKASTTSLQTLMDYIYRTWMQSRIFTTESWSVYMRSIRTNNDVEGWHNRLNSTVNRHGAVPFYLLVQELHKEAGAIPLQMKLVTEGKLRRHQRRVTSRTEGRLFDAWEAYRDGQISTLQLLKKCSELV